MSRWFLKLIAAFTLLSLTVSLVALSTCTLDPNKAWLAGYKGNQKEITIYVLDGSCALTISTEEITANSVGIVMDRFVWSTDKKLAWVSGHEGNLEVYVWDGETISNVSSTPLHEHSPVWSSDGRLAWGVGKNDDSSLYVWDGTTTLKLTPGLSEYATPIWSSDGRLAWMSNVNEDLEIQVWDGVNVVNVSHDKGHDLHPVWSSDGRLAWTSNRAGNDDIYVWDGTTLLNISAQPEHDRDPIWSEDGRIAWIVHPFDWDSPEGGKIHVWDGENVAVIGEYESAGSLAWLADGRLSWIMGHDTIGTAYLWDGAEIMPIADHAAFTFGWSANGWLAWQGSSSTSAWDIYIWNGVDEQIVSTVAGDILSWGWSPDRRLAWLARDELTHLYIWDGKNTVLLEDMPDFYSNLVWSPISPE